MTTLRRMLQEVEERQPIIRRRVRIFVWRGTVELQPLFHMSLRTLVQFGEKDAR